MKRVLQVIHTSGVSGAENHLAALAAELPAFGWRADLLLAAPQPDRLQAYAQRFRDAGGSVAAVAMRSDASLTLLRALRKALAGPEHDVVHTHLVHADWHGGLAALAPHRTPLLSTKHNHDPFRARQPFKAVESTWLRRCAGSIAISDSLAAFVERHNGVRPTTVLYGWPAPVTTPQRSAPVRRLLAVGRLEPQKGFDVLIEAVAAVRAAGGDVVLDVAGEGSERPALEAVIDRFDLRAHVRLLGQRDDVPELMAAADLFVHTARWEGFGLVLLEAMAAGLPIVATRVGAIPEVVAADVTGLLVQPGDAGAVADAVRRIVGDPQLAARLGDAGVERLRTQFSPSLMAERTVAVYEAALHGR